MNILVDISLQWCQTHYFGLKKRFTFGHFFSNMLRHRTEKVDYIVLLYDIHLKDFTEKSVKIVHFIHK